MIDADRLTTELSYEEFQSVRDRLVSAIQAVHQSSSPKEQMWLSRMWAEILGELAPGVDVPESAMAAQAFAWHLELFQRLRRPGLHLLETADWITPEILVGLQAEALSLHENTSPKPEQVYGAVGPVGHRVANDSRFRQWVEESMKVRIAPNVKAHYIYYDFPGQRCKVHIDNPEFFTLNCLVGISHTPPKDSAEPSVLRVFDIDEVIDIDIQPGNSVLFHSAATAHGRTPLATGEQVTLMTIGMLEADN